VLQEPPKHALWCEAGLAFISNTSGTLGIDYNNNTGSGNTISYNHKLAESLDVKVGFTAEEKALVSSSASLEVALNLSNENNWGNTATSDATTTSSTGITITHSAINSSQAYAFYPTVYATQDGTIKVEHAADPLGSASGREFWSTIYGAGPDPALNLPLRFVRNGGKWIPNADITRKKMRGFFVLSADPDPVTGEYDILGPAPTAGQKVRLSAQVYNYSTSQAFTNCLVQFYAIQYDSMNNEEIGQRQLIGSTTISALPTLSNVPAQIVWDTSGFGPPVGGGQDYRIYVDVNYDGGVPNEIYPPEDPEKQYATGLPIGVDPGQNDEGFGYARVMAPPLTQANVSSAPVTLSFGPVPLAIVNSSGSLRTHGAIPPDVEYAGTALDAGWEAGMVSHVVYNGSIVDDVGPAGDDCEHGTSIRMTGRNIGDLMNKGNVTWGWFYSNFQRIGEKNGKAICSRYDGHYEPFQYYPATANPHHLPPMSLEMIGKSDRANHQYDLRHAKPLFLNSETGEPLAPPFAANLR
jgi:hypothetical protein